MIEAALITLAAAAVGAFLNRLRGGGFKPAIPRFGLGRSLWLAAPLVGLIAWPFVGAMPALFLFLTYLVGSVQGWGSYFDLGRKASGWADDPEVSWIDTALLHLFGPEWADDKSRIHPLRVDVIYNEGRTRPRSWRFWRDFTGMSLRGLHYLPMMAVLPLVSGSWLALGIGAIAVALFGSAYWLGWKTPWGTGAGEYIVGGIFGAALAAQYLIAI